jgi:hypothetical protein
MSFMAVVLVALVAGCVGGVIGAAFMEVYFQRMESNKIGRYECVDEPRSAGKHSTTI